MDREAQCLEDSPVPHQHDKDNGVQNHRRKRLCGSGGIKASPRVASPNPTLSACGQRLSTAHMHLDGAKSLRKAAKRSNLFKPTLDTSASRRDGQPSQIRCLRRAICSRTWKSCNQFELFSRQALACASPLCLRQVFLWRLNTNRPLPVLPPMCFPFGSLLLAMFHNNSCVQALEKLCATICSHGESFLGTSAEIAFQHRNRRMAENRKNCRRFSRLPSSHGLCLFVTESG